MSRPCILTLVYNDIRRDSRVLRSCHALARDYDVVLISAASRSAGPAPSGSFRLIELPFDHTGRAMRLRYVLYWAWVLLVAKRVRFDAVHCHDVYPLAPALALARLRGVPLVYDAHELVDYAHETPTLLGGLWDRLHRIGIKRADEVITPNESRAEFLIDRGYEMKKVPTAILNIPDRNEQAARTFSREELGLAADDFVLIYQGYVADARHTPDLIQAFAHLPDEYKLLLVGDGPAMDRVRAVIESCDLGARVRITGYLPKEDVLGLMLAADAGIVLYDGRLLNNYYCAPNKLFDYVNARLPFVGSDLPEIRRFLDRWPVGVIAERHDPVTLADAIRRVRQLRPGAGAFAQVRERFSWAREAERLRGVFSERVLTPS